MQLFGGGAKYLTEKDVQAPNLLLGSHDFSGNKWIKSAEGKKSFSLANDLDPNGNKAVKNDWGWFGLTQNLGFSVGDLVTIGAYIKNISINNSITLNCSSVNAQSALKRCIFDGKEYNITSPLTWTLSAKNLSQGEWHWLVATFLIQNNSNYWIRWESNDNQSVFEISSMIIIKGAELQKWYPNASDFAYQSDLDALKAEIDQLKQNK